MLTLAAWFLSFRSTRTPKSRNPTDPGVPSRPLPRSGPAGSLRPGTRPARIRRRLSRTRARLDRYRRRALHHRAPSALHRHAKPSTARSTLMPAADVAHRGELAPATPKDDGLEESSTVPFRLDEPSTDTPGPNEPSTNAPRPDKPPTGTLGLGEALALSDGEGCTTSPFGSIVTPDVASGDASSAPAARAAPPTASAATAVTLRTLFKAVPPARCVLMAPTVAGQALLPRCLTDKAGLSTGQALEPPASRHVCQGRRHSAGTPGYG